MTLSLLCCVVLRHGTDIVVFLCFCVLGFFGGVVGHGLAIFPLLGTMAIYLLEVLVSFIQAFIFTYLTGLFLSQLIVHDHDHGHDESGHAPSH